MQLSSIGPFNLLIQGWKKLSQMQHNTSSIQETEEDQRQTHGNINYQHTMILNSFNVQNITTENCYNNIPVTRSSFLPLSTSVPA